MNEAGDWGDNFYTCMVCEKHFRSPLFEISRSYERTIFFDGDRMPEVEPIDSVHSLVQFHHPYWVKASNQNAANPPPIMLETRQMKTVRVSAFAD